MYVPTYLFVETAIRTTGEYTTSGSTWQHLNKIHKYITSCTSMTLLHFDDYHTYTQCGQSVKVCTSVLLSCYFWSVLAQCCKLSIFTWRTCTGKCIAAQVKQDCRNTLFCTLACWMLVILFEQCFHQSYLQDFQVKTFYSVYKKLTRLHNVLHNCTKCSDNSYAEYRESIQHNHLHVAEHKLKHQCMCEQ